VAPSPGQKLPYLLRVAGALSRDPAEAVERIRERVAERRERRAGPSFYTPETDWEARLHALLGVEWPCAARPEFDPIWSDVRRLLTEQNLSVGRGAYGGWDDADPAFARAVWCLARHLRPANVVETGVARGITTRFLLEAIERNGSGRLWSIDLPPLLDRELRSQTAAAIPERCRKHWQYVEGSSRRRLPPLLADLDVIDLFVHDSIHTGRNLRFELDRVLAVLGARGAVVSDDVHMNAAFQDYGGRGTLVCPSDDGAGLFGIIVRGIAVDGQPRHSVSTDGASGDE
jgi:Methyltransferase domain